MKGASWRTRGLASAFGLVVMMLLGLGRVHPVLVVFLERRLILLVLPAFVNRLPAFPFGPCEGRFRSGLVTPAGADKSRSRSCPLQEGQAGVSAVADERLEFMLAQPRH